LKVSLNLFFLFNIYIYICFLEQRKKDDPPVTRKSSISGRKISSAATVVNNDNYQPSESTTNTGNNLPITNPISNISAYIRRKSDSYVSRRRSDDHRNQRQQAGEEFTDIQGYPQRNQTTTTTAQVHIAPVKEENETQSKLRQNLSRKALLKHDEDFL